MMFKALLKKQLMEVFSSFFRSKRTGKQKSTAGTYSSIIYYVVAMVFVGFMLYIFTGTFAQTLLSLPGRELDWLYFAVLGIMAILIGTFGSLFSTMSALYQSKDNEMLISMPIPPYMILTVRMISVFLNSLIYSSVMWIPSIVRYAEVRNPQAQVIVFCIILGFLIALFVTVLSCAAGFLIALISGRLRNKSYITVIISLVFFGIYYFFCFRINTILASLVGVSDQVSSAIRTYAYPFYALGMAATGQAFYLLIFALIVVALFAVCCLILARTFIRITTLNKGEKKAVYREKTVAQKSAFGALISRERIRFTKSATYMLNCGIGLVLLPAASIVALFYKDLIRSALSNVFAAAPQYDRMIPVAVCAFVCLASSINMITAPSISLEGKTIWLIQSLPVRTIDIFHAKELFHILLNLLPATASLLILAYVFRLSTPLTLLMLTAVILFIIFDAGFGLKRNLKHPNLSWTNENIPIKQGASVGITLFACWGFCVAGGGLYFFVLSSISPALWIGICCAVMVCATLLNERWIRTKGTVIFEEL